MGLEGIFCLRAHSLTNHSSVSARLLSTTLHNGDSCLNQTGKDTCDWGGRQIGSLNKRGFAVFIVTYPHIHQANVSHHVFHSFPSHHT